jgi:phage-related protein
MANWFSFAGVTSTAKGVYVQDFPPATLPEERAEFVDVPGRSGSLTVLEGDAVYDDIILTINCYVRDLSQLDAISAWLRGSGELVLGNMPDRYYVARCVNQIEIAKLLRASGHRTFAVVFRCQPYRYIYPPVAAYALDATIKTVATQAGSGTPSPENVRAISGKESVAVGRYGKNIFMPGPTQTANGITKTVNADGSISLSGTASAIAFFTMILPVPVTGSFVFSANNPVGNENVWIRANQPGPSVLYDHTLAWPDGKSSLFTGTVINVVIRVDAGTVLDNFLLKPQLEIATADYEATPYEPYAGNDYTLTPSAPLYGLTGYEDEINNAGILTHNTALKTLRASDGFAYYASPNRFWIAVPNMKQRAIGAQVGICSHAVLGPYAEDGTVHFSTQNGYIFFFHPTITGITDFNNWLEAQYAAGTPVQVLYELATPTTATVAPVHIYSATGTDTVLSDGAVTEYTFGAVESILLTAPADIVNTGTAEAIPKITVVGSGDIDLTIGGRAIHIDGLASAITIDCETGMAKEGSGGDLSADLTGTVSMDYYPWTIQPGTNAVAWTGSVTSVTITPAWRYV